MRPTIVAVMVMTVLVSGCHSQPRTGTVTNRQNVITREQIDATQAANVYELIARLHGNFLNDRGRVSIMTNQHARAVVFLNDQEYGIPETLRNFSPDHVGEIRFFSGTDAVARFGAQYGGGVIQIISRVE